MPIKPGGDGTLEVDVDTIFDPTQFPSHDSEKFMHGMEQFVELCSIEQGSSLPFSGHTCIDPSHK